jgi:hypothetical protein
LSRYPYSQSRTPASDLVDSLVHEPLEDRSVSKISHSKSSNPLESRGGSAALSTKEHGACPRCHTGAARSPRGQSRHACCNRTIESSMQAWELVGRTHSAGCYRAVTATVLCGASARCRHTGRRTRLARFGTRTGATSGSGAGPRDIGGGRGSRAAHPRGWHVRLLQHRGKARAEVIALRCGALVVTKGGRHG